MTDNQDITSRDEAWREKLRQDLKPAERSKMARVEMPEADPEERSKGYIEVNRGLTPELAKSEASRCLDCKNPTCISGCPVGIDIPGFIKMC